jgi:acyl-CoA thioesterase
MTPGAGPGQAAAGPVRGLGLGSIFHRDGTLIATVAQEGIAHISQPRP